jgi:hypothetical protein
MAEKKKAPTKNELREQLSARGIQFTDKETVKELKEKLAQSKAQQQLPPEPFKPFMLMEAEDEHQILAEMQGAIVDKFVFCFKGKDGKEVVGLSKAGVDQICRESANKGEVYRVMTDAEGKGDIQVIDTEKTYQVKVRIGRFALIKDKNGSPTGEQLLDTTYGSKQQPKYKRLRSGQTMLDPFAYEVAVSKAIRNGKRDLLPYTIVTEMIKKFRNKGHERVIDADAKISEGQIRFIHQVGSENGYNHEGINAIVVQEFGYQSLSQLRMTEVNTLVQMLKDKPKSMRLPDIPIDLIGLFNVKNILPGKREALWRKGCELAKGDVNKAVELVRGQIAKL